MAPEDTPEPLGDHGDFIRLDRSIPRTPWQFQGRHERDGVLHYGWSRDCDRASGYLKLGFVKPVDEFWPAGQVVSQRYTVSKALA